MPQEEMGHMLVGSGERASCGESKRQMFCNIRAPRSLFQILCPEQAENEAVCQCVNLGNFLTSLSLSFFVSKMGAGGYQSLGIV